MSGWLAARLGAWLWPAALAALAASHTAVAVGAWTWRGDREVARQAAATARQQDALFRAAEELSRAEYALRLRNDALAARAQEHDHAVLADPRACLVPDSDDLSRLRARWGSSRTPAD